MFELLDGLDVLHRSALHRLAESVGNEAIDRARSDLAVAWLLEAYAVGDPRAAAEAALDEVRPALASHGGSVQVVEARDGIVRLRLGGACAGCTASAATLRELVDDTLRGRLPGFVATELEEEDAEPHPPPVSTPVELGRRLTS